MANADKVELENAPASLKSPQGSTLTFKSGSGTVQFRCRLFQFIHMLHLNVDANRLNKLIRRAGSVLGVDQESLAVVSEGRMLRKLLGILDNGSHPLHATLVSYRSTFSHRLRSPKTTTQRHRRSFLPVAIKLFNSSPLSKGH